MRVTNLLAVLLLAFTVACSQKGNVKPTPNGKLYDRLGGKNAITAVVDKMIDNIASDARIKDKFANADIPGLKGKLVDQICQATGGPCQYTGKDMKTAHQGMGLTEADFNALVEDLVKAMDDLKVGQKEKDELIALLAPMKSDVVEAPAQAPQN